MLTTYCLFEGCAYDKSNWSLDLPYNPDLVYLN
jgi:hypothetical protein